MYSANDLTRELKQIYIVAQEDYDNERYQSYEFYISEYNRILKSLQENEMFMNLVPVLFVSEDRKAAWGVGYTSVEISRFREVIVKMKIILNQMDILVGTGDINVKQILTNIFTRFNQAVRQLRKRYSGRPTLDVDDEYDVQDLLHSLLKLHFDDIRAEEWTPSYAGGAKRMDFLLKNEQTVIEVKKTRKGLLDKEIGEQLLIDIETYKNHADCKTLLCFVYDPDGRIINPIGLENDLKKQSREDLEVEVFIYPK